MKIIIGLGNIGEKYDNTRHNAGFIAVEEISKKFDPDNSNGWQENTKLQAYIKEISLNGEKTLLVKPTTFMNLSGIAAQKIINYYKLEIDDLTIIFDDIDLPLGEARFREKGSAGTHNGVKSIITHLNTDKFKRIKLGIENRSEEIKAKFQLSDYVLAKFTKSEQKILSQAITKAIEIFNKST